MTSLFEKYHAEFKELTEDEPGRYAFRGQKDADWPLESSASHRMREKDEDFTKEDFISHLETQFINPAKLNGWHYDREVNRELYDLEILARFQHYGAATCLLDFTRSFHVALWFACRGAGQENKNGKVFIINTGDTYNFNSIGMEQIKGTKLSELLYGEKAWYWDLENLTERVARQNSVFILSGDNLSKGEQYKFLEIEHGHKEGLIKEMEDLFSLRPENLFKDIFGLASINGRNNPLPADDPDTSFKEGNKSFQSGDYDEAIKHYSKAIELKPDFAVAYYNRGLAYSEKEEYDLAIEDYNKAIKLKSDYAKAYNNRGGAYSKKGEYDLAIEDYNEAIELKPDYAMAHNNRGVAYNRKEEYDRAIEDFDKAIKFKPDYALAYNNRGDAYYEKGEYDLAIEDYTKAIELKPDYAEAYTNRGGAYYKKGEYDRAIADYTRVIDLRPNDLRAYRNRGAVYQQKGELEKAKADFAEANKLAHGPSLNEAIKILMNEELKTGEK